MCLGAPFVSLSQVHANRVWTDVDSHPLRAEGTVTFTDPARGLIVLHENGTSQAFCVGAASLPVVPGQRIVLSAEDCMPQRLELPGYPWHPQARVVLPHFELVSGSQRTFFFSRWRGLLHPPRTGEYRFAIASDDSSQLFVGANASPASLQLVASVVSYCGPRDWLRAPGQRSGVLHLEEGRTYAIEVLHHQARGDSHLSVAWEGPGLPLSVIDGAFLRPVAIPGVSSSLATGVLREEWTDTTVAFPWSLHLPPGNGSVVLLKGANVQSLGEGSWPLARPARIGEELYSESEYEWVQVEGTVSSLGHSGSVLRLELEERGAMAEVLVRGWTGTAPPSWRGRRVSVIGVCGSFRDVNGRSHLGRLWVPDANRISVLDVAPSPDSARPFSIAVLAADPGSSPQGMVVRASGRLVSQKDRSLIVEDAGLFHASVSLDGKTWESLGEAIDVPMSPSLHVGLVSNSANAHTPSKASFLYVAGLGPGAALSRIGTPSLPGSSFIQGDKVVLDGVDGDIWNGPDQFSFFQELQEGDSQLLVRLDGFDTRSMGARAGIMMRESLSPDSPFVDLVVLSEQARRVVVAQWRGRGPGRSPRSSSVVLPVTDFPLWLRLRRQTSRLAVTLAQPASLDLGSQVDVWGHLASRGTCLLLESAGIRSYPSIAQDPLERQPWRPLISIGRLHESLDRGSLLDFFALRGVVTFSGEIAGRRYLSLQDPSGAILLTPQDNSRIFSVPTGTAAEVCCNPGWSAPSTVLHADNVFNFGAAALPKALVHPSEYLLPRRGEGVFVELNGIVRALTQAGLLEVKVLGEVFLVHVVGASNSDLRRLIDARVRARGVVVFPSESERMLLVPDATYLECSDAGSSDPFALQVSPLGSFSPEVLANQPGHRVRVRGRVTYSDRSVLHVQDDTGGARVELQAPGLHSDASSVEVCGFPEWGESGHVVLRHAIVRDVSEAAAIVPKAVSLELAASGQHAGLLLVLEGELAGIYHGSHQCHLELREDGRLFRLSLPEALVEADEFPLGSRLRLLGISTPSRDQLFRARQSLGGPSAIPVSLLLRDANGIVVLSKPSWWVVRRTIVVAGLVALSVLVSLFWIHSLRRRVAQRTRELAVARDKLEREVRISATLAERDRLAGEIHDSVSQGLNALKFQLENVASHPSCSPEVQAGLALASGMAAHSRTEVQHAVWELQSPMLEDSSLEVVLEKVTKAVAPPELAVNVFVEGKPRRLPSDIEHHLLRVAQEACNNTVKHAAAQSFSVRLVYEEADVLLEIRDDGRGFDPSGVASTGLGRIGLHSMRGRAAKIKASFVLDSAPGRGTSIFVRAPVGTA